MSQSGVLARAVVVLEGDSTKLDAMMTAAQSHMLKTGEVLKSVGEHMTTHLTLELAAMGTEAVHAYGEHADAVARLDAMLAASGGIVGTTSEHLQELGMRLQETTTFSHDVTDSAMAVLLSFQDVRNEVGKGNDVFDRTVTVAQNLSELMGRDLQGAMLALGRTMEDPAAGMMLLRRSGIVLSQQVQQQIKAFNDQGLVLEAQKLVLSQVELRVRGLADEMAKTPFGQFRQAWNDITMAFEGFGKIMMKYISPALVQVRTLAHEFEHLSDKQKTTIIATSAVVASIGPLLVGIGTAIMLFTKLGVVVGLAGGPLSLIVLAIAAVGAAVIEMTLHWDDVKEQVLNFWQTIKGFFYDGVDWILGKIQTMVAGISTGFRALSGIPGTLGVALGLLTAPLDVAGAGVQQLRDALKGSADKDMQAYAVALAKLEEGLNKIGAVGPKTAKKVADAFKPSGARVPAWTGPVLAAFREYNKEMDEAGKKSKVLGRQFDLTGAQVSAHSKLVDAVSKTYVDLDTVLDKTTGVTLRKLIQGLQSSEGTDALKKLSEQLIDIGHRANVLGIQFDDVGATASAYQSKVDELIAAHYGLDQSIDGTTMTLRKLILLAKQWGAQDVGRQLHDSLTLIDESEAALGITFDATAARAGAYHTAVQALLADHKGLNYVIPGTTQTLGDMIREMQKLDDQVQLSAALKKTFTGALDSVVDFAFGAKRSFSDFIRSALIDLTKLIIEIEVLNLLKNHVSGNVFDSISKAVLGHANGGVIGPGQWGMVGERGPELMMGGRSGVTIVPSPGMAANRQQQAAGDTIHVHLTVPSIDQRSVAQFFEENTGLVAQAMLRAKQQSSHLRTLMGG